MHPDSGGKFDMFDVDFFCFSDVNYCDPEPCENGATCTVEVDDYSCACMAGYEGKNCSQSMIHHFPSSSYHYRDNSYMSEKIFTIQHLFVFVRYQWVQP